MNGSGSLIPEEEIHRQKSLQLAPLADFFLLALTAVALIATTWTLLYEETTTHTSPQQNHFVLLKMDEEDHYKWVTQFNECLLNGIDAAIQELRRQQTLGLLPQDREKIQILLRVDSNLHQHHIERAILAIKQAGFTARPFMQGNCIIEKN